MHEHRTDSNGGIGSAAHSGGGHGPPRTKVTPTKKHHDRAGDKGVGSVGFEKSEKSEKKNVSHVPCKFFRQSICQAGDKCSFSHELDSNTQAVCKYYQKGNCKFGAKCALAHITPDGRQVNRKPPKEPKDGLSRRKDSKVKDDTSENGELSPQQSRTKTGSASSQTSDTTIVDSNVQIASRILSKYSSAGVGSDASAGSVPAHIQVPSQISQQPPQQLQMSHSTQPSSPRMNFNAPPFAVRSLSSSLPQTSTGQRPLAQLGALTIGSASTGSPATAAAMSPPQSHPGLQGTSWTSYRSLFEGSAIVDDDDDTLEESEYGEEEEEGFREQLVPSTLTDLLTPLECERRNSRTSAQKSGRVFSSPSAVSSPFGLSMRRASNGSAHELLSSSAPLQDLWSPRPRNNVFPVQSSSYEPTKSVESRALPKAPIGTPYSREVPPIEMDGAYQPFQQFNRAIAR